MKAPFKVLYSNDFTNLGIVSPYHKKGEPFHPDMLRASVDEAVGADVHMLQPAHGWVPWWPSKVYSLQEHHAWWAEHYGIAPDKLRIPDVQQYIVDGGDPFAVFVDECRKVGQAPFISLRLNDTHHFNRVDIPHNRGGMHAISRFYVEHPEYRLGPAKGQDWAIDAVRAHKFAFIQEICENYDIDGFELDFMRFPFFFKDDLPEARRIEIMVQFISDVRALLDRTAKPGQHRWLCARVPSKLDMQGVIGCDLPEWVDAGLDMVNLSSHFFTTQDHDMASIRQQLPDAALYLEMCHCTQTGKAVGTGGDNFLYQRTADEQLYTTALQAYQDGADGMSLFNFVYYREHGVAGRGPFNEPPFHVLKRLADPQWLAQQPQWYFHASNWFERFEERFVQGDARTFKMRMSPNDQRTNDGVFRLMVKEADAKCQWMVKVNGTTLTPTDFVRKPLPHPYNADIGAPEQYACFVCPRGLVRNGTNRIAIILEAGGPATIEYMDLVLP